MSHTSSQCRFECWIERSSKILQNVWILNIKVSKQASIILSFSTHTRTWDRYMCISVLHNNFCVCVLRTIDEQEEEKKNSKKGNREFDGGEFKWRTWNRNSAIFNYNQKITSIKKNKFRKKKKCKKGEIERKAIFFLISFCKLTVFLLLLLFHLLMFVHEKT